MNCSIVLASGVRRPSACLVLAILIISCRFVAGQDQPAPQPATRAFPVMIQVDAGKTIGQMRPVWRFFGYDEPNYTYMKDGLKLLGQLRSLSPRTVYIRAHNLLTSGDGQPALKWGSTGVYTEDEQVDGAWPFTRSAASKEAAAKRPWRPI